MLSHSPPHADNATFARRRDVLNRLSARFSRPPAYGAARILILVLGTSRQPEAARSDLQRSTWCRPPSHCVLVTEGKDEGEVLLHDFRRLKSRPDHESRSTKLRVRAPSPDRCCADAADEKTREFFCSRHRKRTLASQYRFLPALQWAKRQVTHTPSNGRLTSVGGTCHRQQRYYSYDWVALVDDDSYVFVNNLARLLASKCPDESLHLGDFYVDHHTGKPSFACGGGGSIFSRGALDVMDIAKCIRISEDHAEKKIWCQQSDWMIGMCARMHNVNLVDQHGGRLPDVKDDE